MSWKIGVSDPWSTELPASLEDVAFKAQKAIGLNLFHLRLPGMHMASSKYPHNAANAVWIKNSRLQDDWFDRVRARVAAARAAGMTVIVSTIDFWAVSHLQGNRDPFTAAAGSLNAAWGGWVTELQKEYLYKLVKALSGLDVVWLDGNEGVNEHLPSENWRRSWLQYMKSIGAKGKFGHYANGKPLPGFDFHDVHGDILGDQAKYLDASAVVLEEGCSRGQYCSKDRCWGGDAKEAYYRKCIEVCKAKNIPLCFAYWDWYDFGNKFAPNQIAALKWAGYTKPIAPPAEPEDPDIPSTPDVPWWKRAWRWFLGWFK